VKLISREELVEQLTNNKKFRNAFTLEYVKNSISSQLRVLREQRKWTQADLGRATGKPRNVITRLENPNNNIPSLATMLEMAWGCETALLVKIVPFSQLLEEYEAASPKIFLAAGIADEKEQLRLTKWVNSENKPRKRRKRKRIEATPDSPLVHPPLTLVNSTQHAAPPAQRSRSQDELNALLNRHVNQKAA
jgi:transcriptional regulator with XRE-family HTH domain